MNNEFEKKLMEQPLRQTPPTWRAEILRDARDAVAQQTLQVPAATGWRSWLWPAPRAWAALAACWLVLLAVNYIGRGPANTTVAQADTACLALALAEKQRALQDVDVVLVANHAKPVTPRLPSGASGWLRDEKGELPC